MNYRDKANTTFLFLEKQRKGIDATIRTEEETGLFGHMHFTGTLKIHGSRRCSSYILQNSFFIFSLYFNVNVT